MSNKFVVWVSGMLIAVFGVCGQAFANTAISAVTISEGRIMVNITTDSDYITYVVCDTDKDPEDMELAGFGERVVDRSDFSFNFGLGRSGSFTLYIHDGVDYITKSFDYAGKADRDAFAAEVTNALRNPETAARLNDLLTDSAKAAIINTIGIDFDIYAAYPKAFKDSICGIMAENGKNQALDEKGVLELYNLAVSLTKLNIGESAAVVQVLDELNYSFEGVPFAEITDAARKTWIAQIVAKSAPYTSLGAVKTAYERAVMLYGINTARVSSIETTLKKYAEALGIASDMRYQNYIARVDSTIDRKLVDSLSKNPAQASEQLLVVLGEAVGNTSPSASSPTGSSGFGGSGGGGAASSSVALIVPNKGAEDGGGETDAASAFSDVVSGYWAYDDISALKAKGVLSGYGDGMFRPDDTVTREEYVKMIIVLFGLEDKSASSYFYDVFDSDWFYPYVSAAFEKGIVKGSDKGMFGVNAEITRQDAAVIASRVMGFIGAPFAERRDYTGFADASSISDYALEAVKALYRAGKINGMDTGRFEPARFCTRAEAAAMLCRISSEGV
ncbi:hypothetical protein FACS189492_2730 [Clostridia bacterium]|nr:hypothetical protein FACS189492_2730 [Clostridia bacterium]